MTYEPVLEVTLKHIDVFHVAGLSGRYDPSTLVHVNELWAAFVRKAAFAGRLGDGETCGVFRNRDPAAQSFEHLAGARVRAGQHPDGLEVWTLPAGEYLVFRQLLQERAAVGTCPRGHSGLSDLPRAVHGRRRWLARVLPSARTAADDGLVAVPVGGVPARAVDSSTALSFAQRARGS